jgi:hypothetical protein
VVVGADGVLTARHVVADALAGAPPRILARLVRAGHGSASWVPMTAVWHDPGWDIALLRVDSRPTEAWKWQPPEPRSAPAVVQLGTSAEEGCEAVGFPSQRYNQLAPAAPLRRCARPSRQMH